MAKQYLGDGLYVEINGLYDIVVTSEDGISVLERVIFDTEMVDNLKKMVDRYVDGFK